MTDPPPEPGDRRHSLSLTKLCFCSAGVVFLILLGYIAALTIHAPSDQPSPEDSWREYKKARETPPGIASSPDSVEDLVEIQQQLIAMLGESRAATVSLSFPEGHGSEMVGSGVVVTRDGHILTAGHVSTNPGRAVTVIFENGDRVRGETLGRSMIADTGMVKIVDEGRYPFVPLAPSDAIAVGQWCYALGFPGGFEHDRGVVTRIGRLISISKHTLRTDCKLLGGDSGGPLFNLDGQLIGIHSRISNSVDENYHAPISAFQKGWDSLVASEVYKFQGGYLGVETVPLKDDAGLLVKSIVPGSTAEIGGLRHQDIITRIDGERVIDHLELKAAVNSKKPGDLITLTYLRGSMESKITARLGGPVE